MSEQILHTALMAPKQEVQLTCKDRNVMSVDIPVFEYKQKVRMRMISILTVLHLPPVIWMRQ